MRPGTASSVPSPGDYGLRDGSWTVAGAEHLAHIGRGPRPIRTAGAYVAVCRRLARLRGCDRALEGEGRIDGRLVAVGYRRVSPTEWIGGEMARFLSYWQATTPIAGSPGEYAALPVGSDRRRVTPEEAFTGYRLGYPAESCPDTRTLRDIRRLRPGRQGVLAICRLWAQVGSLTRTLNQGDHRNLSRLVSRSPADYTLRWAAVWAMRERSQRGWPAPSVWEILREVFELPRDERISRTAPGASTRPLWHVYHGRLPADPHLVAAVPREGIAAFVWRPYLAAKRALEELRAASVAAGVPDPDADGAMTVDLAVRLAATFGGEWKGWLARLRQAVGRAPTWQQCHDACYWLPKLTAAGLPAWLRRQDLAHVLVRGADYGVVAAAWASLSAEERLGTLDTILAIARARGYSCPVQCPQYAGECARWGVGDAEYPRLEAEFLRWREIERESIPPVDATEGGYRLVTLPRGDVRGPWLGSYTDCCQHPGGAGESCARHGTTDPDGGFWVVLDRAGTIVAQSWIWRRLDVVVADNIEAKGGYRDGGIGATLLALYRRAAESLVDRLGIRRVHVGMGYNDLMPLTEMPWVAAKDLAEPPSGVYSDARSQQRVLAPLSRLGAAMLKEAQ